MKKFVIILKSGAIIKVESENVTLKHIDNELIGYHFTGIKENTDIPLYISINEIAAVIQCGEDGKN